MAWTKNRDKLHEAAISTVKAISKNKKLTSNKGLFQRPPSGTNIPRLDAASPSLRHLELIFRILKPLLIPSGESAVKNSASALWNYW